MMVNASYQHMASVRVERINNVAIADLQDVAIALARPLGDCHVIEIENYGVRMEPPSMHSTYGRLIVIDVSDGMAATNALVAEHNMGSDRNL